MSGRQARAARWSTVVAFASGLRCVIHAKPYRKRGRTRKVHRAWAKMRRAT